MDENKAAYYVAFGPHGPRMPVSLSGQGLKVLLSTPGLVGVGGACAGWVFVFSSARAH